MRSLPNEFARQQNSMDQTYIFGFVDDKRQYANDLNNSNLTNALKTLHHATQTWQHLLSISGGKLEIDKCEVFIMSW